MGATRYDNGNTTALQITDPESDERLTIIQFTIFGKSSCSPRTSTEPCPASSSTMLDTLRKIKDYLDESIGWMES